MVSGTSVVVKSWEQHEPEVSTTKTEKTKEINPSTPKPSAPPAVRLLRFPGRIQAIAEAAGKKPERDHPPKVILTSTPVAAPKSGGHPPKEIKSALKADKVDAKKPSSNNNGTHITDNHNNETNSIDSQDRANMFLSPEEIAAKVPGRGSPRKSGLPARGKDNTLVYTLVTPTRHLGSSRVPIFSLKDAENRLFDPYLGYKVELRHAFEFPEDVVAEDVQVHLGINLERGRGNPRRDELAMGVKAVLREAFRQRFPTRYRGGSGTEATEKGVHLRVYVVDVSEGDRATRMLAPQCEIGLVRLCLAWIVCSSSGDVVFDGGRIGMTDNMCMGMLDVFHFRTGLACLTNKMAPKLANQIMARLNFKSGTPFYQCW